MAGELASGRAKGITEQLRNQLAAGEPVEIAGYRVLPALAEGLEAAELVLPASGGGQVIWLEISLRDEATLAPVSLNRIEHWQATGCVVHAKVVRGPAFWQTSEIEDAPELIAATQAALGSLT